MCYMLRLVEDIFRHQL